ncbi:MAG TPA: beta-galactosidase GalA [Opitutus sp.]|nr:beta-galactosidase GalA [Opitutus sp.]
MKLSTPRLVAALLVGCAALLNVHAGTAPRERLLMDFGWKFHLGDEWGIAHNLAKAGTGHGPAGTAYSDAGWRRVDLPHDWAVELPFDEHADAAHGFKALGPDYPQNDIGWYRKTFDLPAVDEGRRLWLAFDGVFRDCTVFVNGWLVGHHEGGYNGFRYDISDVANYGGPNVVAVRVDASQFEGWFYEGAGIYRHVWLEKTAPLAVAPDGVFVYSTFPAGAPEGPAELHLEARVKNAGHESADASVAWEVFSPTGERVAHAEQSTSLDANEQVELDDAVSVDVPSLWSPETPRLYKLVTTVTSGDETVDRVETVFGIRTFGFDAEKGFLLNGKVYELKGTCNHQDHAGVGAALPDALQYFRIAQLKKMGANAYRTAHNPPTPELLEACDRLGMLVMDESRLLGSSAANLEKWDEQIRRDRNHASVAIWSVGNEEFSAQGSAIGGRAAAAMQAMARRLDPSRPVTYNSTLGNEFDPINAVVEVRGWSYRIGVDRMDAYHAAHPQQPNVGSEQGSTVSTRGIYANDPARGYVSAYDDNKTDWSNTAEEWMSFFAPRPWLSGGFVWTGFDYRGEPTPYAWPCINSHFGILDTCGFPKDNFWYYQSWWTSTPVLHLLPHWNWAGREGQDIDVRALSNCDEVELFLNGRSLGKQAMQPQSELKWKVPYAPGTLAAKGYTGGKLVAETQVVTTGAPAAVQLAPDRATIDADGEDVAVVTVSVVDADGRVVPTAGNPVSLALDGPGRIIGVGNGDPSCHEPDQFIATAPVTQHAIDGWKWKRVDLRAEGELPEMKADADDSGWEPANVTAEKGPLGNRERAVYRAHVAVTPEELAQPGVELWFGRIEGDNVVYINGEPAAKSGDARSAVVYDVKSKLRAGDNVIAVSVSNWGDTGGLAQGAALRLTGTPPAVTWSRSAFNGLAEVIVQAMKASGTIKLTATAEGLKPVTLAIDAKAVAPRPAVE